MSEKFRSIAAFRDLEQRTLGKSPVAGAASEAPSALRVLAAVKKHPQGATRAEVARELGVDAGLVDAPVLELVHEGLIQIEQGAQAGEERLVAA